MTNVDPGAVLRRVETRMREISGDQPDWAIRGLVAVRLNHLLAAASFEEFQRRYAEPAAA